MADENLPICGHPELFPWAWNQSKPAPRQMVKYCECGENYGCPVCGFGHGTLPCTCMRARRQSYTYTNPLTLGREFPKF